MNTETQLSGADLVSKERERQINEENYSWLHDAQHKSGELAIAACCYATPSVLYTKANYANSVIYEKLTMKEWNLDVPYNGNVLQDNSKFQTDRRIKQLIKAGALICAEIDRLQNLPK